MSPRRHTAIAGCDRHRPPSDVSLAIAELQEASRKSLADRWRSLYRSDPPQGVRRPFLIGAIAHELQIRQEGRSRSSVQRRLERAAKAPIKISRKLKPGARLIREWNGSIHSVDVIEDGYLWNGARYRSLSAIARAITGTRWSGPRFFGLAQDARR